MCEHTVDIQVDPIRKTACHKCGHVVDVSSAEPLSTIKCPKCGTQFTVPGRLGPVVLLKALGRGAMGATFKAYEKALSRHVAVKVMHKSLGDDPERIKQFFSEARSLASLEHPNVARAYSVGKEKGQPYIVMELVAGEGLDRHFSAERPLDELRGLAIAADVARALEAAGEVALTHLDVKPANIMLDEEGTAKLVDFGLARSHGRLGEAEAIGTPYYVSPEQVSRGHVDHRSDIFSLGATLFHALTGSPPFTGAGVQEVLEARLSADAPHATTRRPELHPMTAEVIARMLRRDPDQRYQDYPTLLDDLQQAYLAAGGESAPAGPDIPHAAPTRASWRLWALPLVVAVAVGVALVLVLWPKGDKGPTAGPGPAPGQVRSPSFSVPSGPLASPVAVTIGCETPEAQIHYTIDGSAPTADSPAANRPVRVAPPLTLKARAYRDGWRPSEVAEVVYTADAEAAAELAAQVAAARLGALTEWERTKALDDGQGFAAIKAECDRLRREAEEIYQAKRFAVAANRYENFRFACADLLQRQHLRAKAVAARGRAAATMTWLEQSDPAGESAPRTAAREAQATAEAQFERGEFGQAEQTWNAAAEHAAASGAVAAARAKAQYAEALAKYDTEELASYAKQSWKKIQTVLDSARRAEVGRQFDEAQKLYQHARQMLPAAARAVQAGRRAAKAARLAAKVTTLLAEARSLGEANRYRKALATATEAQKLGPRSAKARSLVKQLQGKVLTELSMGQGQEAAVSLAWIPAGRFTMGSPRTEPGRPGGTIERAREVSITKPFYMSVHEVTRRQFAAFIAADGDHRTDAERMGGAQVYRQGRWVNQPGIHWRDPGMIQNDQHPVICVSWRDAAAFCRWLSEVTKRTVRLPTEAEWEYACRAGTAGPFSFDPAEPPDKYVYNADAAGPEGATGPSPVDKRKPNAWGLRDTHGNVAEWCADRYGLYPPGEATDPTGPARGATYVLRGGGWTGGAGACRSAARDSASPTQRSTAIGFRVVVECPP